MLRTVALVVMVGGLAGSCACGACPRARCAAPCVEGAPLAEPRGPAVRQAPVEDEPRVEVEPEPLDLVEVFDSRDRISEEHVRNLLSRSGFVVRPRGMHGTLEILVPAGRAAAATAVIRSDPAWPELQARAEAPGRLDLPERLDRFPPDLEDMSLSAALARLVASQDPAAEVLRREEVLRRPPEELRLVSLRTLHRTFSDASGVRRPAREVKVVLSSNDGTWTRTWTGQVIGTAEGFTLHPHGSSWTTQRR